MVAVSMLPHAEFGPNGHREDAPHFIIHVHISCILKLSLAIFEAMFGTLVFGLTNETDADFRVASFCISTI